MMPALALPKIDDRQCRARRARYFGLCLRFSALALCRRTPAAMLGQGSLQPERGEEAKQAEQRGR
jgi:hypothetical protein